ncbi:TVP38/TMEM64 family protein [Lysinibacillus sp. NPDC097214]|uniref:TVP38/TMEM64 family protein n=1 Tax=Lysinibacillus sp. NPDC097214 TaxID=3390584 RepID=UPI003CFD02D9
MNKRKLIFRVIGYIIFVLCLFFLLKRSGLTVADLTPETIRTLAHNNILLILLIMLVIMMLQNLFTFIPLVLVIATNITLFGFWYGYLYSCLCSVIGSTLIFLSIRYFFQDAFSNSVTKKYQEKIEKKGFLFVLSGRILPFIPTNLINIASGVSSLKISHFVIATTIGNMIYGLVLASTSFFVILATTLNPLYLLLIVLVILLVVLLYRVNKRSIHRTQKN